MSTQRSEAEALAVCLEIELADVSDAVAWADREILASDIPHHALCDVSVASQANNWDVASMLRRLPGDVDSSFVLRRLIESAAARLRTNPRNVRRIALALYQLAMDGTLPSGPLQTNARWFYDAIDLAESRTIQETPDQIIIQMADALDAELAIHNGDEQNDAFKPDLRGFPDGQQLGSG